MASPPREDISQTPNFDPETTYFGIDYSDFFKYLHGIEGDVCLYIESLSF